MVKSVFYVEKEKFLRSLFETALKAKKREIHTVESLQDNLYLLEDLTPALVLLDIETIEKTPELIPAVFDYKATHPGVKIVTIGSVEQQSRYRDRTDGFFSKPIEVSQLAHKIIALID
jgi:DNA-binding NtrC family response regulator